MRCVYIETYKYPSPDVYMAVYAQVPAHVAKGYLQGTARSRNVIVAQQQQQNCPGTVPPSLSFAFFKDIIILVLIKYRLCPFFRVAELLLPVGRLHDGYRQ